MEGADYLLFTELLQFIVWRFRGNDSLEVLSLGVETSCGTVGDCKECINCAHFLNDKLLYTLSFKSLGSVVLNTFILQGHIKLIKINSKDIYNQRILKKK